MNAFSWFLASVSLLGGLLVVHGRRLGFALWAYTSAAWGLAALEQGLSQQAAVQAMYVVLALYGLSRWRRHSWRDVLGAVRAAPTAPTPESP